MFRVTIEDKKESIFFAIALGCVLLVAIGATWLYWTQTNGKDAVWTEESVPGAVTVPSEKVTPTSSEGTSPSMVSHVRPLSERNAQNRTLYLFITLIAVLLIVFGLTFRYYSHREVKEAEKRWQMATRNFVARMSVEQASSGDVKMGADTIWSRILRGEEVESSEIDKIPVSEPGKI